MAAGTFSIDRCPHSKQRIFLSVDVTDSTKIKSSLSQPDHTSDKWAKEFLNLLSRVYTVYKDKLYHVVNDHCPKIDCNKCGSRTIKESTTSTVKVWKYIGDEVVLFADLICNEYQASLHVLAMAETIKHFNNMKKSTLQIKGTAWVAGFPVDNIEYTHLTTENHEVNDFLGPLIDLGFRLTSFATKERLIISASLAFFITKESKFNKPFKYMKKEIYHLPLCFGGFREVKGVKEGKHPLIWYSINETEESELCIVDHDKLQNFLIGKEGPFFEWLYEQFIPGTQEFDPYYIEEYDKAIKEHSEYPTSLPVVLTPPIK